jgi:iron complex outermembrane recepter protein
MTMTQHQRRAFAAATTGLLLVVCTAEAQAPSSADTAARLAPITVTAQRVTEDLQDVPMAVSTLSGARLGALKASAADVRFLSARVPGVVAESSFGRAFPRFYIRGIGNTDFDLNATQPISMVYDDVPYESPILKGFPVFDLAGIEVLRAPQGTLFGRNTPGGVIKFDSAPPSHSRGGYVRASYGTYDTADIEGAVNLPLFRDELALRISGLYQTREPYVDNTFTGETDRYEGFTEGAGRVQLLFTPINTGFRARLNLHARDNDSDARLFRANIIDRGTRGIGSGFDRTRVAFDGDNFLRQQALGTTLRLDQAIGDTLTLTYVFGREDAQIASRLDGDGGFGAAFLGAGRSGPGRIPFASESGGAIDALHQTTHELRFAWDAGGRLSAQGGVFLFDEELAIISAGFNTLAPGRPQNGLARREGDTVSTGVFASLAYDVTDRLTLAGGARWTDEEKTFRVQRILSPIGAGPLGPISDTLRDDDISWDISALYAATPDVNLYARAAKGYRGPSTQGRLVFGNTVSTANAETVLSLETGIKSEAFEQRLRANANLFFYQYDDQQLTIVGGLTNTVALFNADQSEGYGFEAEVEALPVDSLLLTANVSYTHTEFKDDLLLAPGCGGGCTVRDPAVFSADGSRRLGFNISGNAFPYAPEWIGNVTARYAIPTARGEFYAFTDWTYKGALNFFLYDSAEFGEDGYWEGGLRLGYVTESGLDASVFARNITDEARLEGAIDFNNLTGFVNEPRTFGAEIRLAF